MSILNIAVVIVSYKSARLTVNALKSIEAERANPALSVRAIVVDNASGDFDEIARAVAAMNWTSWVTVIDAPKNGGFAYGNNLGIARAWESGAPSYVYLLNPDTEIRPGAIAKLADFLESRPAVGIAGSSIENDDGSDWPIAFRFPTALSEFTNGLEFGVVSRIFRRWEVARTMTGQCEPVDWICGASMMIRPTVLDAIGGLDENYFLYFEETDFCRRAWEAGFETWYVPDSRIMHIMGQSTKVTAVVRLAKRLPGYWFESRRRYFAVTFGTGRAILIDAVAVFANSLGLLKRMVLGRTNTAVPHFIRDLIEHSIIWPRNRVIPPVRGFKPGR